MFISVVAPPRSGWPKMEWVAEALQSLGHRVARVRSFDGLVAADAESDLVLFEQRCAGLNYHDLPGLAERRRATWVQWVFDLMWTGPGGFERQPNLFRRDDASNDGGESTDTLKMMRLMDVVFVKERSLLSDYAVIGVNARWLDQACPSWIGECEHPEQPEFDVCLFASFNTAAKERWGDVQALSACFRSIGWSGHSGGGWPSGVQAFPFTPPSDLPAFASRAAVTLCVDQRNDLDGYRSDRLWLALGMGACVARRWSPGLPPSHDRYLMYEYPDQVLELIDMPVDRRSELGASARRYVMGHHTYEHRCRELLREVEEWRSTKGNVVVAAVGVS